MDYSALKQIYPFSCRPEKERNESDASSLTHMSPLICPPCAVCVRVCAVCVLNNYGGNESSWGKLFHQHFLCENRLLYPLATLISVSPSWALFRKHSLINWSLTVHLWSSVFSLVGEM